MLAKWLKPKYYRNFSDKGKVIEHGKLSGRVLNKCDIDTLTKQPETPMWPPKPETLISPKL